MKMTRATRKAQARLQPRLRVLLGEEIALGPGKVELLASIRKTGSIRQAAESMGMSYMRAWKLIKTMNACFKSPVVDAARGGSRHGGAMLTETGKRALRLYQEMEDAFFRATKRKWPELRELLKD